MTIDGSNTENVIQAACADSLVAYFDRQGITYRQLWTYANQQGEGENQFCADLVGVINSSTLLLMEFKALDHQTEHLMSFDDGQYREAKKMSAAGVPIVYCYDNVEPLPYNCDPRSSNWPIETLRAVNAARPDELRSIKPLREHHGTLLDWVEGRMGEQPTNKLQAFGKAVGCMMPNIARNKIINVLFSKEKNEALMLNEKGLASFDRWLAGQTISRDPLLQRKLEALRTAINQGSRLAVPSKPPIRKRPSI